MIDSQQEISYIILVHNDKSQRLSVISTIQIKNFDLADWLLRILLSYALKRFRNGIFFTKIKRFRPKLNIYSDKMHFSYEKTLFSVEISFSVISSCKIPICDQKTKKKLNFCWKCKFRLNQSFKLMLIDENKKEMLQNRNRLFAY